MNLREAAQHALETLEAPWAAKPGGMLLAINTLRAALAEATIKDNLTVEPVAYVTGFTKGRCTIAAVDPAWLPPVGMALYRSPPKRNPLTDEEIHDCFQQKHKDKTTERRMIARAIERAHGIGGEE